MEYKLSNAYVLIEI